jgi:hypothetical protein
VTDSLSPIIIETTPQIDEQTRDNARLLVAGHARSAEDCRLLLQALGLD